MKSKVLLLIVFFTISLFANSTSSSKIKAGMPANFYPYFQLDDNNKPTGFAVEIFKNIAKMANIDYEIVVLPTYVDVEKAYINKEIDLIIAGGISEKRKKIGNFTTPIDSSKIYAYKLKSNPIKQLQLIDNKKITLKTNNVSVKLFKDYPKNLIRFVNSKEEALLTLLTKESDVFVFNEVATNQMLEKSGFKELVVAFGEPIKQVDFAIRVQKDKVQLFNDLNNSLLKFKESQHFKNLYEHFILGKPLITDTKKQRDISFSEEELAYIENNAPFKIGYSTVFEPLLFKDETQKLQGIVVDIYNKITLNTGIEFEYILDTWKNTLLNLQTNQIDIIPAMAKETAIKKDYLLTTNITDNVYSVFKRKNNYLKINSMSSLKGLKIAYNKNILILGRQLSLYDETVELIPTNTTLEALIKLDNGEVDSVISFKRDNYLLSKHHLNTLEPSYTVLEFVPDVITAIKPKDTILQSIISKAINNLSYEDKQEIFRKWIGAYESKNKIMLTNEQKLYLESKKYLTTQLEKQYYPYLFNKNGETQGFIVDLLKLISLKLNKEIKYVNIENMKEAKQKLLDGQIDFMNHYIKTPQRQKEFLFSNKSILNANIGLIHKSGKNYTFDDTKGKSVAVVKGYHLVKILKQHYPDIKIHLVNNNIEVINAVLNEKSDFGLSNYAVLNYLLRENQYIDVIRNIVLNNKHFYTKYMHIVFNNEDLLLKSIFDKAIESIPKYQIQELTKKWFDLKKQNDYKLNKNEFEYLQNIKEFNVCPAFNHYPLSAINDGKVVGIGGDILNFISNKLSININLIPSLSYKNFYSNINSDNCDIVVTINKNQTEFKNIDTSDSLFTTYFATIGNTESMFLNDYTDFKNYKIYVKEELHKKSLLKKHPNLNVIVETDIFKIMDKVKKDSYTLFAGPEIIQEQFILKYGILDYKINHRFANMQESNSFGVNAKHPLLLSSLNKVINEYRNNELKRIIEKYFIKEYKIEKNYNKILAITLFISLLIIIFLLLVYARAQKKYSEELNRKNNLLINKNKELEKSESKVQLINENLELIVKSKTEELSLLNENLKKEVQQKTEENIKQFQILQQQNKLAAMGEMIGAIAHQWRQPLNELSIRIQKIQFKYDRDSIDDKYIESFVNKNLQTIDFMSKTIDNFRNFFRIDKEKHLFGIKKAIEEIIAIQNDQLKHHNIKVVLLGDEYEVYGFKMEFQQVIINLISNSKDAISKNEIKKGLITITVNKNVILVEDNAKGIPPEILQRVFEPYFTTKDQGEGTGMGLYLSKMIIEDNMQGKIIAQNKNEGALFTIRLKD